MYLLYIYILSLYILLHPCIYFSLQFCLFLTQHLPQKKGGWASYHELLPRLLTFQKPAHGPEYLLGPGLIHKGRRDNRFEYQEKLDMLLCQLNEAILYINTYVYMYIYIHTNIHTYIYICIFMLLIEIIERFMYIHREWKK